MAYAMTKRGSLDNCITYEFMCDTVADMNAIEDGYRTLGSVAIVLNGESGSLEVYITDSSKEWHNFSAASGGTAAEGAGLKLHLCTQDEVEEGLPNISNPDENTIYLVPGSEEENNLYEEYFYIDDGWEKFGSAGISLNDISSVYAPIASPNFTGSISLGRMANTTIGIQSVAEGGGVTASGSVSHAEGAGTTASGDSSHAEGQGTIANGRQSHAEGQGTIANGRQSHAEGQGTTASGSPSHAEGTGTTASGPNSHSEGLTTRASGDYSHAEGAVTTANGNCSHVEGQGDKNITKTINNYTYTGTGAHGFSSHSEGAYTWSIGDYSHAEGYGTIVSGIYAHAEGSSTTANGYSSHAEGSGQITATKTIDNKTYTGTGAYGEASHAEGEKTWAIGNMSHAEGRSTTASGNQSHAEGANTTASGDYSHTEGNGTIATGASSHSEGVSTIAAGAFSHVSGEYNIEDSYANWPEWTARTSYKVGDKVKVTTKSGSSQTIEGYICKTANSDSTFTSSKWTSQYGKMNYAEIIGNGTYEGRSNARSLDWDGNEHLMGDLYVGCNADSTGGVKIPRIPSAPSTDGTYTLQVTVTNGTPTYSWVSAG